LSWILCALLFSKLWKDRIAEEERKREEEQRLEAERKQQEAEKAQKAPAFAAVETCGAQKMLT